MFQEPVHIQIGKDGAYDPTLRSAASAALPTCYAPRSIPIPFFDRCLEPHFDEAQNLPIYDTPGNGL
jgi:hypothetical protein